MIEVKHVSKRFGEKEILKDISFTMYEGKTNLIIGASGSGKTVMMKCMIGLMRPEEGAILYHGVDITKMNTEEMKDIRRQIGMLFQGSALFDSMTVQENVMFPLNMFTRDSYKKRLERVNEVLEQVKLKDANKKYPAEISGGRKKRVALARAIVLNPKFLFCDEPNSGLDPQTSLVIDNLIAELTKEYSMTTIINTHDMNTVMESGDHIIYMHQGRKQWEGSNREIVFSDDQLLNSFIFASDFLKGAKNAQLQKINEENRINFK